MSVTFDNAETTDVTETIYDYQTWVWYFTIRPDQAVSTGTPEGGEGGEPTTPPTGGEGTEGGEGGESTTPTIGRELTDAEKEALSGMGWFNNGQKLDTSLSVIQKVCNLLAYTNYTYENEVGITSWFSTYCDATNGMKNRDDVPEANRTTYDMIVPGSIGGTKLDEAVRNTLTAADFEVGDILILDAASSSYVFYYNGTNFKCWNQNGNNYRGTISMDVMLSDVLGGTSFTIDLRAALSSGATTYTPTHNGCDFYCIVRVSRVLEPVTVTE